MTGEEFRSALRAGKRLYGTLTVSNAARWPDMFASLGLDFIFIDTEHVAIDREALSWMCQTYAALGIVPLVRITSLDPAEATTAMDAGAKALAAPFVETAEQVKALRGAVKLRPMKGKRLEGILNGESVEPELARYLEEHNRHHTLMINVESVPAMEELDSLLAVDGLDAVFIGPHDLSTSLGIPEQYDHPRFDAAVTEIITRSRAAGVGVGIHVTTGRGLAVEDEIRWIKAGANLIVHRADIIAAKHALQSEMNEIRKSVGDPIPGMDEADLNI